MRKYESWCLVDGSCASWDFAIIISMCTNPQNNEWPLILWCTTSDIQYQQWTEKYNKKTLPSTCSCQNCVWSGSLLSFIVAYFLPLIHQGSKCSVPHWNTWPIQLKVLVGRHACRNQTFTAPVHSSAKCVLDVLPQVYCRPLLVAMWSQILLHWMKLSQSNLHTCSTASTYSENTSCLQWN